MTRFKDSNNGTITDYKTGLIWMKNAAFMGEHTWVRANERCEDLSGTNWRLPTIKEFKSLIDCGQWNPALPDDHLFINVQNKEYWTGISYYMCKEKAWFMEINNGTIRYGDKEVKRHVWLVNHVC